jgi:hypothetical protein
MARAKVIAPPVVEQDEEEEVSTGKELVNWEEKMAEMAVANAKQERVSGASFSLQGGIMSYGGDPVPNNNMDVVVLGSAVEHSWYDVKFDRDRIVPPRCFGVGSLDDEMVPHEHVPIENRPLGADGKPVTVCRLCPKHAFKSADNGKGRACSVRRRLALVPAGVVNDPEEIPSADLAVLKVMPTSVENWGKYVNTIAARFQRPAFGVVTNIALKPHARFQYMAHFEHVDLVPPNALSALYELSESCNTLLMAPFDMTPPDEEEEEVKPTKGRKAKY